MGAYNFEARESNLKLFPYDMSQGGHDNLGTTFWQPALPKFIRAKDVQNLVEFRTTSDFDRGHLQNKGDIENQKSK